MRSRPACPVTHQSPHLCPLAGHLLGKPGQDRYRSPAEQRCEPALWAEGQCEEPWPHLRHWQSRAASGRGGAGGPSLPLELWLGGVLGQQNQAQFALYSFLSPVYLSLCITTSTPNSGETARMFSIQGLSSL